MVNRSMQAKEIQLKKYRRKTFGKKYSSEYIPVSTQGVSKRLLNEDARDFQDVGNRRANSGSATHFMRGTTSFKEAELRARNAYIEAMFPSFCGKQNNAPRAEVIRRVHELLEGVPVERSVTIARTTYHKELLFWNDKGVYFLVKVDLVKSTFQRTINYPSREAVLVAREHYLLRWKKPVELNTG